MDDLSAHYQEVVTPLRRLLAALDEKRAKVKSMLADAETWLAPSADGTASDNSIESIKGGPEKWRYENMLMREAIDDILSNNSNGPMSSNAIIGALADGGKESGLQGLHVTLSKGEKAGHYVRFGKKNNPHWDLASRYPEKDAQPAAAPLRPSTLKKEQSTERLSVGDIL